MSEGFAYVGKRPCGCVRAVTVDAADKLTAKDVSDFIRRGLAVERVPVEDARTLLAAGARCGHKAEGK